jgi:hypothetical protein
VRTASRMFSSLHFVVALPLVLLPLSFKLTRCCLSPLSPLSPSSSLVVASLPLSFKSTLVTSLRQAHTRKHIHIILRSFFPLAGSRSCLCKADCSGECFVCLLVQIGVGLFFSLFACACWDWRGSVFLLRLVCVLSLPVQIGAALFCCVIVCSDWRGCVICLLV